MPIVVYIASGLALAIIIGAVIAFVWIGRSVHQMECKFGELNQEIQDQDHRICALEREKKEQSIKYSAMEGAYRSVLAQLDLLTEWAKQMWKRLTEAGIEPPAPPPDLDIDLRTNGRQTDKNGLERYL
jgi:MFS superfamily sulfate permease-like transporter